MQTESYRQSKHYGCGSQSQSQGPEIFYGYCHESRRMRLMNYPDYVNNMQTGYSNLYSGSASAMQPLMDTLTGGANPYAYGNTQGKSSRKRGGCGCHEENCDDDCGCKCCIRCADVVEYARCGEVRQIPITFENETRRERPIKLELGAFLSESGQQAGWQSSLSATEFTLPPCGRKTILVSVNVDCGTATTTNPTGANATASDTRTPGTVDSCKVAYATLRGDGCIIRPLVIAVAVLPIHCDAHHAGCGCGCC